jgi:FMN-dependent NADH-azoreductase
MPKLLSIEVSPRRDHSTSRTLAGVFIDAWRSANPGGEVVVRDLAKTPPPFVDLHWIGGAFGGPDQQTPETLAALAASDELIAELRSVDEIVLGTPLFNFSIPATLKAYIDQIIRVGVTVSPDNVGLVTGKKATIILASGGDYSPGSPTEPYNLASGYLRQVFGFIGITDLDIILAGAPRAGRQAEAAIEAFGERVRLAAAA